MFHFLAKIGKKPWARSIMPFISTTTSLGYVCFHVYGHNLYRNLLAAHSPSGKREEISGNLQNLIMEVFNEIRKDYRVPVLKGDILKNVSPPLIKWFVSSSAEPVTLGMSEFKTGIVIGLPSYYNYEKREDVPENILEVNKIKLFKSWNKDSNDQGEKDTKPDIDGLSSDTETVVKTRIKKDSPEAQKYIESIILSENAKKFSIARELFFGDTYRPMATAFIMALSMSLSLCVARGAVLKLKLANAHLSQRLPFYLLSGLVGYGNYIFVGDSVYRHYSDLSDSKAIKINDSYRLGAIEYFTKTIERNKAIRNMIEDMRFSYNEDGDRREGLLRLRYTPLKERLEVAKKKILEE